ncbi:SDR family oxidoreductase [Chryseobacterium sp. JUb7]|uniref:SDR family oxidoreductase n=1 Tax=Chryseobacterium sp. JUb7 TaxID=2940599 RepID=UPI00216818C0|nr:SDR family oxidoreductase [Chryseobacterium sp. JUb7]MCS3532981.1 NAD(P)-dependent dehydrogenase (short-subunit alcohol dehydrogenase family) [Chryseobacterium sp. JUb7]
MQKTIFITGASSGLGKTTAKLFHSKGWKVIATVRNPEKETELDQFENIKVFKLDVSKKEELENTVFEILKNYSVDVVLNNAGYGLIGPLEAFSDEQIQRQIETNLMGVIRVTKAFTPYFRAKNEGVFINITSTFGLMGFPTCSVYSATKFAVDGFSECMAYELAQFNVKVKVVAPGGIQTDFAGRSLDGAFHESYQKLISKVQEGYSPEQVAKYSKPEDIAQTIFEAATDEKEQLRYVAGKDANELYSERMKNGVENQVQKVRSGFVF